MLITNCAIYHELRTSSDTTLSVTSCHKLLWQHTIYNSYNPSRNMHAWVTITLILLSYVSVVDACDPASGRIDVFLIMLVFVYQLVHSAKIYSYVAELGQPFLKNLSSSLLTTIVDGSTRQKQHIFWIYCCFWRLWFKNDVMIVRNNESSYSLKIFLS